mgnify:CR=1 FL=1
MKLSLNEVDAVGRKAARGAGLPWGLAEEAGRAARWLAERGLPGPAALAGALQALDGAEPAVHAPRCEEGVWQASPGPLSPFAVGAALWDRATDAPETPVRLGPCLWPVLLLPYAGWIAQARGRAVALTAAGLSATVGPEGALDWEGDPLLPRIDALTLAPSAPPPRAEALCTQAEVAPDIAAALDALGHRTYAPATEASRLAGAGAGLTDND